MDRADRRPIHLAAANNNFEIVQLLLDRGADVHCRDKSQKSCLHSAAVGGCPEVATKLIEFGVEIDSKDCNNDTSLHIACLNGKYLKFHIERNGITISQFIQFPTYKHSLSYWLRGQSGDRVCGILGWSNRQDLRVVKGHDLL